MLFISVEDFWAQARAVPRLSRAEEKALAQRMINGDQAARQALIRGYLPIAASAVRRAPQKLRTLRTAYACVAALEKGVDSFNFLQDGETFVHHLGWRLRQCITRCLVDRF